MGKVVTYKEIKSSESCKYDGVSLGEVMLRFDPFDVPTARARLMRVFQGGGETNGACGLAYAFGLRTAVITALVDDDIGKSIRNQLREAGVDTSKIIWFNTKNDGSRFSTDQKGTLMNGINFTFNGKGVIPSDTLYYRAHTPVRELREGDVDWDTLFDKEGVRVFNTGGIYTLISPTSAGLAIQAVKKANEFGTFVAADLNYRSKVEPNKKRARDINSQITPYLGFLVGNDSDLHDALGYETKIGAEALYDEWVSAYQETVRRVAKDFPNLSLIGTQWRGATNADVVSWGAVAVRCCRRQSVSGRREGGCSHCRPDGRGRFDSPPACWPPCSKAKTSRRRCNGVQPTACWCRKPRAIPRWRMKKLVVSEVKRATARKGVRATR